MYYRKLLSVLLKDWRRYRRALTGRGSSYLELCNRYEHLEAAPDGKGYRCDWRWTSDLHAPKLLPALGLRLMKRALADHPIRRAPAPENSTQPPHVSFVIGHRGLARLPHLLATLESIAAQREVSFECVVVEQSNRPEAETLLPDWVRYTHTPLPRPDMPYSRSWTFNVGAAMARGHLLILHDNDMLVPQDYAAQVAAREREGYEVINAKRFVFYLDKAHSGRLMTAGVLDFESSPEIVVQNLEAGGSFAITREAFFAVGGFDESFVGWGGEDNEFWERAQTRNVWPYGYLPLVHLWHEPQPEKLNPERSTEALLKLRSSIPARERIEELRERYLRTNVAGLQSWVEEKTGGPVGYDSTEVFD